MVLRAVQPENAPSSTTLTEDAISIPLRFVQPANASLPIVTIPSAIVALENLTRYFSGKLPIMPSLSAPFFVIITL